MTELVSSARAIALNERGAKMAVRLGLPVEIGKPSVIARTHWNKREPLVFVMALPIVIRTIADMDLSKASDPPVVAIDESGRFIIPVLGGHNGSNRLANELASRCGGTAVVTTASEAAEIPAIDGLSGFVTQGEIARVIESMLDGRDPHVEYQIPWPGPVRLREGSGPAKVIISDADSVDQTQNAPTVQLIPPSLVAGVGCSTNASLEELNALIDSVCRDHNISKRAIAMVATIDLRESHPALVGLGLPIVAFSSSELSDASVPNPSPQVNAAVGTPSVAEAAALLASRSDALVVAKTKSASATVAIARRKPRGVLRIVGLGPGRAMARTPEATEAIMESEVVVGYSPYIEQCAELLSPRQLVVRSPIGEEEFRALTAVNFAVEGRSASLVCSGDPEIFAMASLAFEVLEDRCKELGIESPSDIMDVAVIPGVTAGLGGGALLGAPLGNDHAYLSLSDLLTPWATIEKRLHAFGEADVTIVIYNPKSKGRTWQLQKAIDLLARYRPKTTPVAVLRNVSRQGESKDIYTLETFDATDVDMTSIVIIGSSTSRRFDGYIVTPRGYRK